MLYRISQRGRSHLYDVFKRVRGFGDWGMTDYYAGCAVYEYKNGGRRLYVAGDWGGEWVDLRPWMFDVYDSDWTTNDGY